MNLVDHAAEYREKSECQTNSFIKISFQAPLNIMIIIAINK